MRIKKKLDPERLAIAIVAFPALILLTMILIFAAPELLELAWILSIVKTLAEYASYIAGGAYIGRVLNLLNNKKSRVIQLRDEQGKTYNKDPQENEKLFTSVGMLYGMMFAITLIVLGAGIPYFNIFSYFAYFLFTLGYVCGLGGLGNRLGSSIDGSRLPSEKKAIFYGVILGALIAIAFIIFLSVTGSLPFIAIAGVSKAFFDLFVLHKALFYIGFFLGITGIVTSYFDYFSKAYCFLKSFHSGIEMTESDLRVESRRHEYRGAFFGLITGLLLATSVIAYLTLTGGFGGVAPLVICGSVFIISVSCTSIISAFFSRIGRVMDGIWPAAVSDIVTGHSAYQSSHYSPNLVTTVIAHQPNNDCNPSNASKNKVQKR